jgi:predicted site-specific integrase-resolvase
LNILTVWYALGLAISTRRFSGNMSALPVLDQPHIQEPTEELMRDMLTIVTVFAGRLYGQRAKGLRTRVQSALKACEQTPEGSHGTDQADHQTAP